MYIHTVNPPRARKLSILNSDGTEVYWCEIHEVAFIAHFDFCKVSMERAPASKQAKFRNARANRVRNHRVWQVYVIE